MLETKMYLLEIKELTDSSLIIPEKYIQLKRILERLCKDITSSEVVQFPNLFSRLVFIAQKYKIPEKLEWQLQHLRVKASEITRKSEKDIIIHVHEYKSAVNAVNNLCSIIENGVLLDNETITPKRNKIKVTSSIRVQIENISDINSKIECIVEKEFTRITVVHDFQTEYWKGAQLNLINCYINSSGEYVPEMIVLEPDYLIDISSIAECFQNYDISHMHYFRNKFEDKENRSYILMGNLANFFLDELIYAHNIDKISFNKTFISSFKQTPFEYMSCEDIRSRDNFVDFMVKAEKQFNNIKRVVKNDFPKQNIELENCTLEPSFYSEKFGIQGRLDLLQTGNEDKPYKIIELKSGRLPYPTSQKGKIALNHEVQTSLYRLMIESVFGETARNIDAAILYSSGENSGENLRFAAVYKELDKRIISLRNSIIVTEYSLINGNNNTVQSIFEELLNNLPASAPAFYINKIQVVREVLSQCSDIELAYFYRYIRFIARELYIQKIGDSEYESPRGTASLWNSDFIERAESLDLISNLTIELVEDRGKGMTIIFTRNKTDNDIVNFREGEICIVYPRNNETDSVLNKQILKGNIVKITTSEVEINFRYKQKNKLIYSDNKYWVVEHDTLDSSYNSMYKSLYSFIQSSKNKRNILLCLESPEPIGLKEKSELVERNKLFGLNKESELRERSKVVGLNEIDGSKELCESNELCENNDLKEKEYPENIIDKAMSAKNYFLIVGPPGTGKTSIFARRLIEEYYSNSDKNILVLAYTNRAVDELCEAINSAFGCNHGECDKYIRVGSELSCAEPYRKRLLQNISDQSKDRDELRRDIQETRIFVSTLASIYSKMELFKLKKFDIAIIDEASQILEPQIIGLLPKVDKFIMIGDHNQLSTIVLQKQITSEIKETELTDIGITDCRDSLFERMLRVCIKNKWTQNYTQLNVQGRMHNDIASFPATYFYEEGLFPASTWQNKEWQLNFNKNNSPYKKSVATKRVTFFSTEKFYEHSSSHKVNNREAEIIVKLTKSITIIYKNNNKAFDAGMLGIIAPYRNQIALIKHSLAEANIPDYEKIMVDTVERFQGSQRDIVIVSFCINKPYQFNYLSNMSSDGKVDRKLNVALTRARQQLFLVGNAQILKSHPVYATLVDFYKNDLVILDPLNS